MRKWLRADTGTAEALPLPPIERDYLSPLLTQNGIVVSQGNPFEGVTGNSVLPKYLLGSDAKGRELWRFPAKPAWSKDPAVTMGAPETLMRNTVAIPNTDVFLAEDTEGTIYGLRLRDGKPNWKLPSTPFRLYVFFGTSRSQQPAKKGNELLFLIQFFARFPGVQPFLHP